MFDWSEFLEFARHIQNQSDTGFSAEAANRSCVSRAYYAAFCTARNYAEAHLGFARTGTPRDHALLRQHLQTLGGVWSIVAEQMQSLRTYRNLCDYEDSVPNLGQMTLDSLVQAEFVLRQCQQ